MATLWHVKREEQIYGPFKSKDLRRLVTMGRLDQHDELRKEGTDRWVPARKVANLFDDPKPGAPPVPGFDVEELATELANRPVATLEPDDEPIDAQIVEPAPVPPPGWAAAAQQAMRPTPPFEPPPTYAPAEPARSLPQKRQRVFETYWTIAYLRTIWIVGLVLIGLGLLATEAAYGILLVGTRAWALLLPMVGALVSAVIAVVALRVGLEVVAVLFDIAADLRTMVDRD